MMGYYDGLAFFLLLAVTILVAMILGGKGRRLGPYTLAVSVLMAGLCIGPHKRQLIFLLVFLALGVCLVKGYGAVRKKRGRRAGDFHLALALSIAPVFLAKVSPLWGGDIFGFTGVSYLSFRLIGTVIELYDGVIEETGVAELLAYFLFFPSLSSGPIDRWGRFHKDYEKGLGPSGYWDRCASGVLELLWGMAYKFVAAAYAFRLMGYLDTPEGAWYHSVLYAYAYSLYLFFDFAGYSRMAVGTARCLGVDLPVNFHLPFLAEDMRDFWNRWHISLSHWFRDYVFTRFVMLSSRKKWFGSRMNRAAAGFLVNMALMGAWHGLTPSYLCYGLYHGLLLAGTEVYQKKSGFYKKNKEKRWYRVLSWAVTMHLVVFGFYLFSGRLLG